MRDRARAIGGGLTIERRRVEDGSGTRVRLRVPLSGHGRGGE
jgi:signal transduction histidine kinase